MDILKNYHINDKDLFVCIFVHYKTRKTYSYMLNMSSMIGDFDFFLIASFGVSDSFPNLHNICYK